MECHILANCYSRTRGGGSSGTIKIRLDLSESEYQNLVNNRNWAKDYAESRGAGSQFDSRDGIVREARLVRGY